MRSKRIQASGLCLIVLCFSTPLYSQELLIRPLTESLNEFLIDTGPPNADGTPPDIAVIENDTGDFVVVWGSLSSGQDQIYFRRFDQFGNAIDQDERPILDPDGVIGTDADVSVDGLGDGGFLTVWNDQRYSEQCTPGGGTYTSYVYGQYVRNGVKLDTNVRLDGGVISATEGPEIAIYDRGDGTAIAHLSWVAVGCEAEDQDDIYDRPFTFYTNPIDGWFQGFLGDGQHLDSSPSSPPFDGQQDIVVDEDGLFTVTWKRRDPDSSRIKFTTFLEDDPVIWEDTLYSTQNDVNFPSIASYHGSYPDDATYIITWHENGVMAQVFANNGDDIGNLIPVSSGQSPYTLFPRVATFRENDDFIITWNHYEGIISRGIRARAFDRTGSPLYQGEFQVGNPLEQNSLPLPRIDTFRDRIYITWLKVEAGEKNIYGSILTVDNEPPAAQSTMDEIGLGFTVREVYLRLGREGPNYWSGDDPVQTTAVEDPTGRIASGLHQVRLVSAIDYSPRKENCDTTFTLLMDRIDPNQNFYTETIPEVLFDVAGTEVKYYVEAVDSALNNEFDPNAPEHLTRPYKFFASYPGDINFNGLQDDHDLSQFCLFLNGERDFSPRDSFYADCVIDGLIDCADYDSLLLVADPIPPFLVNNCIHQKVMPAPDQLEMGVGYGGPDELTIIPLYLDNDSSLVRDVYYSLEYDTTVIQLIEQNTTPRTNGFFVEEPCCDILTPQIFITGGAGAIQKGSGPILNLKFQVRPNAPEGKYHIILSRGALGAPGNKAVPHPAYRGKFFVPTAPPVSIVSTHPRRSSMRSRREMVRYRSTCRSTI